MRRAAPRRVTRRRAVLVAGLVLAGACGGAQPATPSELALDGPRPAVLEAWLVPPDPDDAASDDAASGDEGGDESEDERADRGGEDVIELGGVPPPREPTDVSVLVTGVDLLRLDGAAYAAVLVDDGRGVGGSGAGGSGVGGGAGGGGVHTAGLFPLRPVPARSPAATGPGTIGLWVSGTAFRGWGDGRSHDGAGVWHYLAPGVAGDDAFSCDGPDADALVPHAYPECLALHLGDDGATHSPVYGFAADGYPAHGPWVDLELLARSSWRKRDYSADSVTGCGEDGRRTCLLADPLDATVGVVPAPAAGPSSDEAPSGAFFEDYWFDVRRDDGEIWDLDAFNGHAHDGHGYHYHVTRVQNPDGSFTDVFPYIVGPWFRGELQAGAVAVGGPPLADASGAARTIVPDEPYDPPPDSEEPPLLCIPRLGICE